MTFRMATRAGLALAVVVVLLLTTSTVAAASTYTYNLTLLRGTIRVGTTPFVTPPTPAAKCASSSTITGTIDTTGSTTATDNITSSINISSADFPAPFTPGRFRLIATGNSTGTDAGNYNHATQTFSGLHFPTIAFSVRPINTAGDPPACTVGDPVCTGTASLTLSGGIVNSTSLPFLTSEQVYVNSTAGHITHTAGCGFPWGLVVFTSGSLSIGPNNPPGTDPGAIFHHL